MTSAPAARPNPDTSVAASVDDCWRPSFPALERWLVDGGDTRLDLDAATGLNRYGCAPRPVAGVLDFASSTASTISPRGWAAAEALSERLAQSDSRVWRAVTYGREMDRVRAELVALNGLEDLPGLDVIFAASGTDAHLLVADLVGDATRRPLVCLAIEPEETGSGVPAALNRRHFSTVTALGKSVPIGDPIGIGQGGFESVASRAPDGSLRSRSDIAADLEAIIDRADQAGRRVVLSVTDVTKTGLIAPDLETVVGLCWRHPDMLQVVIDACQFRLTPASLRAYLEHGFIVAVTGSKFLAGPCFSGAVFVPARHARRLRARRPAPGLAAYSAAADWPTDWSAGVDLPDAANYGLLMRWEAALAELRAFRALEPSAIESFTRRFAEAVAGALAGHAAFEALPTRQLDRSAVAAPSGWDAYPTIFPFLLRRHDRYLTRTETDAVYSRLASSDVAVRLGQPVACGERDGQPVSALRLCNSAPLIVEALTGGQSSKVVKRALTALEQLAGLVAGA